MRNVITNVWVVRGLITAAVAVFVWGAVAYVQSRPDPSPATNTTTYGRDYELPAPTNPYKASDVPKEARQVAGEFILAAAGREDLEKAWGLTHPTLRQGMTKKEWLTGNIPVTYYPSTSIDQASFDVSELSPDSVYLKVLLVPKKGADVKPQVFEIGLRVQRCGREEDLAGRVLEHRHVDPRACYARRQLIAPARRAHPRLDLRLTPRPRRQAGGGARPARSHTASRSAARALR